jgi:TolB protein
MPLPPARSPHVAALAAVSLLAAASGAQENPPPRVDIEIREQARAKVPIALPPAAGDPSARSLADEIVATIRADLEFSGVFDVLDPSLYGLVASSPEKAEHEKWLSIGAENTAFTKVAVDGNSLSLDGKVVDHRGGVVVLDRRYRLSKESARILAHYLADDIVQYFTGRPGIARSRISFVSKHGEGKELYIMDYDGRRIRRITTSGTINLTPAWSPDAQRIAFVSWRSGRPAIHILDSDGTITRMATAGGSMDASPDWSPDGRKLVYATTAGGQDADLWVLDVVSGRNTPLTRTSSIETSPAFSPTGREIAFTSDRSGTPQIYVMDAEGLNVRRLTFEGNYNDSAAWSPRGDQMAYVSRVDGRFEIFVMDVASGATRKITEGPGNKENPRWSPDGRHIVFASNRAGRYDLYTMRADGSDVRRLTTGGDCFTPDWSRVP